MTNTKNKQLLNRKKRALRNIISIILLVGALIAIVFTDPNSYEHPSAHPSSPDYSNNSDLPLASDILARLPIKGRAPRTGYARDQFGGNWGQIDGCDVRNVILQRDLTDTTLNGCLVLTGALHCPYTNQVINFVRGPETSGAVHIDHVVALSDAWQKGAQQLTPQQRRAFHDDPLNLLAVDGVANMQKGDHDAASWLPAYRPFRCQFVTRQINVKYKYHLWITQAEHDAIQRVLDTCPDQRILQYTRI